MGRATPGRISIRFLVALTVCFNLTLASATIRAEGRPRGKITASDRIMRVLRGIEENLFFTSYQGATRVRERRGEYVFDCSGMAEWVLRRSAPAALKSIGRPNGHRPLAVNYYRKIAGIPLGERRGPWYRVRSTPRARPGDIIAWIRPKWFPSKSTGHVAFVVGFPRVNTGPIVGLLIPIADASKFKHEDDSRPDGVTGFGTGVLLIPTDDNAQPTGYGWVGSQTRPEWVVPTRLVIGRPLR